MREMEKLSRGMNIKSRGPATKPKTANEAKKFVCALLIVLAVLCFLTMPNLMASATNAAEPRNNTATQRASNFPGLAITYIESTGRAIAPRGATGAQAMVLARRGAIVDLQRNILDILGSSQVDVSSAMNDFTTSVRARSGIVRNIELQEGTWDGHTYTITGRLRLSE